MSISQHLRSVPRGAARAARAARVDGLVRWHVRSHQTSRRNAMVATNQLIQRRVEREDVEEFLRRHRRTYDARAARATRTG